jgi:hypothetical protein
MIWSPTHGDTAFTVPPFDGFHEKNHARRSVERSITISTFQPYRRSYDGTFLVVICLMFQGEEQHWRAAGGAHAGSSSLAIPNSNPARAVRGQGDDYFFSKPLKIDEPFPFSRSEAVGVNETATDKIGRYFLVQENHCTLAQKIGAALAISMQSIRAPQGPAQRLSPVDILQAAGSAETRPVLRFSPSRRAAVEPL